jgi:hypothetical protein
LYRERKLSPYQIEDLELAKKTTAIMRRRLKLLNKMIKFQEMFTKEKQKSQQSELKYSEFISVEDFLKDSPQETESQQKIDRKVVTEESKSLQNETRIKENSNNSSDKNQNDFRIWEIVSHITCITQSEFESRRVHFYLMIL